MWWRVGRTDTPPRITAVFFSSNKLPKTPLVTLLLFGHVTLLCGTYFCICWVKDLFSYQTVDTIRSTHPRSTPPAYPFTQVRFSSDTTSDTASRAASELQWNFTPHRGGCGELAQDPQTQRVVRTGLVFKVLTVFFYRNQRECVLDAASGGQPQQDLWVPGTVFTLQGPAHVARWGLYPTSCRDLQLGSKII